MELPAEVATIRQSHGNRQVLTKSWPPVSDVTKKSDLAAPSIKQVRFRADLFHLFDDSHSEWNRHEHP